jgi:hypothetical protein
MYDLPTYIWALVLIAAIGFPVTTGLALYRSALAAGLGRGTAVGVAVAAAVVLGGWLGVSGMLARDGVYRQDPGEAVPWLPVAFAGFLLALLLATRIPLVSRILADPGAPARLVLPHALRVVGVVFLIVMVQGHLPAIFAVPAGFGDIAIGVAAPFVARQLARGTGRTEALRFHVLGLVDLVVAVGIGFLLGPAQLLEVAPSIEPLTLLPLALIPTVVVPLAVTLHLVSLRQLRPAARPEEDQAGSLVPRPITG